MLSAIKDLPKGEQELQDILEQSERDAKARDSIWEARLSYAKRGLEITNRELALANSKLSQANRELEELKENLAKKVEERTQEVEAEKVLITTEKHQLEVIISAITDMIIATDREGKVIIFNKAAEDMIGYSLKEVTGKFLDQIIKLNDKEGSLPNSLFPIPENAPEGIISNLKNIKLIGKDDRVIYINLIAANIKNGLDNNVGCILTLHDVSKEHELEDMKLDFVSMAAHELRTPLTALKGYIYLLQHDYKHTFNAEETTMVNRIDISAQRLGGLVENLLNVSNIEQGKLAINLRPTNWVTVVKEIISELQPQAHDKTITLQFIEPVQPLVEVQVDKLRINEVLLNLITNALTYTQSYGQVTIWLEQAQDEVITHIKDTGEGIPAHALPHLFTKFFRVSGKLEQGSKGTGLGLYISKSIVELHHGKIWAESEGIGKGSTFSFTLPIFKSSSFSIH